MLKVLLPFNANLNIVAFLGLFPVVRLQGDIVVQADMIPDHNAGDHPNIVNVEIMLHLGALADQEGISMRFSRTKLGSVCPCAWCAKESYTFGENH